MDLKDVFGIVSFGLFFMSLIFLILVLVSLSFDLYSNKIKYIRNFFIQSLALAVIMLLLSLTW